jgi:hypothetical protein
MTDTPEPPRHYYDGGDAEAELIAAAKKLLADDANDVVAKIKHVYWPLGNILEIAVERGYTKRLGTKAWIVVNLDCSHTHGYACMKAWKQRNDFAAAYAWYKSANTNWEPGKATGPLFATELHKAWSERGKSDAEKLSSATRKKDGGAKKLLRKVADWRSRYERLRAETRKLAQYAAREPIVLNQIELEIAQEEAGDPPENNSQREAVNPGLHSGPETVVTLPGGRATRPDTVYVDVTPVPVPDAAAPDPEPAREPGRALAVVKQPAAKPKRGRPKGSRNTAKK